MKWRRLSKNLTKKSNHPHQHHSSSTQCSTPRLSTWLYFIFFNDISFHRTESFPLNSTKRAFFFFCLLPCEKHSQSGGLARTLTPAKVTATLSEDTFLAGPAVRSRSVGCANKKLEKKSNRKEKQRKGSSASGLTFTAVAEVHVLLPTLLIWTNVSSQILSMSLLPGIKPPWLLFLSIFTERSASHQQESSADALGLAFVLFWILPPQRRNQDFFLIHHRCFKLLFLLVWCVTSWGWTLQILLNQNRTALLFSI